MIEYIDYDGIRYPTREVRLSEYEVDVRISSESFGAVLTDADGEYVSREAQLISELLFTYVPDDLVLNGSDEEVEEYIIEHLEW